MELEACLDERRTSMERKYFRLATARALGVYDEILKREDESAELQKVAPKDAIKQIINNQSGNGAEDDDDVFRTT